METVATWTVGVRALVSVATIDERAERVASFVTTAVPD